MPRPSVSAVPVSDPAAPDDTHRVPRDLIRPPSEIFDPDTRMEALRAALDGCTDPAQVRAIAVRELKAAMERGRAVIAAAFTAAPDAARPTVSAYSYLTDCIVTAVLEVVTVHLHPCPNPTEAERLAVIAVGGYGRAEMAPHSDVDLLFLSPYKLTGWAESVIESMLYILWDLHLKVGHSSRTVHDCLRLGAEDYTIRTALLEHRFLAGNAALADELQETLWRDLFDGTGPDFIRAKLDERSARHAKQGGQRYVVEPNVKEGKGGLRDLQTLFWIAKYVNGVQDAAELVAADVFTRGEFDAFVKAESFLLGVRCHLHLVSGRAMEQLTFDRQVEIAERMGYVDKGGRRAVEHFMQAYFRHATRVGELTRILLTALEADAKKEAPSLVGFFRRRRRARPGYRIVQNRLSYDDETSFLSDKLNLLRIFDEALRTGNLLHPDAMRLIARNLHLIDDEVRSNPEAVRLFLDLMLRHQSPERALRRMNELGVLAAFLPEFEPIVAMMQFNMYHHYTVDEHTIQCIWHLSQIEQGALEEDLPLATSIMKAGVNRKVLYVALLLHDIGKGRPEDHSVVGARIARSVAPRLGLNRADCETVEWLVRYHLLMSDMAQKRDLSDPRTVRDFAKAVRTRKRLDLLTVLTVCDIRGVGPGTWNNWKAQLLRALHAETANALENGLEALNRETRGNEARRALRAALPDWDPKLLRRETQRHYPPYWTGLNTSSHVTFARMLGDIGSNEIRIDLMPDEDRDATRACFVMADHPGIFSRLAGALALVGANVVDARTYTSKDGFATAVFWVQDADGHPYEQARLPRLRSMIDKTLKGEVITRTALESRDKIRKRERDFRVPTSIAFDNEGSEIYTIIEVDTRDRPGLLHDLTRTFASSNISIASAVIATYGAQVVDTFYVKDMFGLKIYSETKQRTLERRLRDAIESGAKRAIS
ncbi:[protein-PII] uridylyltransferase [Profundibacterium mesophilum]|uniref:Bifunctional uridylyltransferase/uridylyl-removing enzyme n=1 Tax=Profundibacterium mesophilum KAUST100406-0324 TaxID=1037889 RepID=A0A921NNV7_9RHOB|nr:[protein-PII] uridylyltransferase [Profundibacterium mesophilum]KAF0675336.1 Protein-PII uridylyltransferase [Profundibacterium mesophilum KAUST100406-0324]